MFTDVLRINYEELNARAQLGVYWARTGILYNRHNFYIKGNILNIY